MNKLLIFLIITLFSFTDKADRNQDFIRFLEKNGKIIAPSYEKANCVQFMDRVLRKYLEIPRSVSEKIYIRHDLNTIEELLKKGDSTVVAGVCWGLVSHGYADWVKPENVKKGDIIQYWSTAGFVNGHCGIYCGQDNNGFILYSSHQDSKGFGKMNMMNKKITDIKIFIVRLK